MLVHGALHVFAGMPTMTKGGLQQTHTPLGATELSTSAHNVIVKMPRKKSHRKKTKATANVEEGALDSTTTGQMQGLNPDAHKDSTSKVNAPNLFDEMSRIDDVKRDGSGNQKSDSLSEMIISLPIMHDIISLPGVPPAQDEDILEVHMGFANIPKLTGKKGNQISGDQSKSSPTILPDEPLAPPNAALDGPTLELPSTPGAASQSYAQIAKKAPTPIPLVPAERRGKKQIIHQVLTSPGWQPPKHKWQKGINIRSGKVKNKEHEAQNKLLGLSLL